MRLYLFADNFFVCLGHFMSLRSERTKWVMFLPCSNSSAEPRHVLDLVFGVLCLERAGIQPQDIFIYIDSPTQCMDSFFNLGSTHQYISRPTTDFFSDLLDNSYDNLVMFISGHGSPFGLDAPKPITPNQLITSLKSTPVLKNAVIYLGQCYAGTFNFVNAGKAKGEILDIILVGATNLHQSLSTGTSEQFSAPGIKLPWMANVFLLHVFKWMSSPLDIDGDGIYTIMDSYKYAGVYTNDANKQVKTNGFISIIDMLNDFIGARELAKVEHEDEQVNIDNKVDCQAKYEMYINRLALHHVHQECWILNSRPAQLIEF